MEYIHPVLRHGQSAQQLGLCVSHFRAAAHHPEIWWTHGVNDYRVLV